MSWEARLLERTYLHRVSAFRPVDGGEEPLWEDLPCGLSRSAHTAAPAPPDGSAPLPEAAYRLTLFTRPEHPLRLGDRVEITDGAGRVYRGRCADSVWYPSHCVTVVEVTEVA